MKKIFSLTIVLLFATVLIACTNNEQVPLAPEIVEVNPSEYNRRGAMYFNGDGVEQSDERAVYWYRQAAELGHAQAQDNLGWMYGMGRGIEQDDAQAVYWFRMAAEQGFANAQSNLGAMYERGRGIEQDLEQARHWYTQAGVQGHEGARESLRLLMQQEN